MIKITIKDVAREAGVSTATISRVINNSGYVSDEVRRHVLKTIEKLNYFPNAIARSLKQEKTQSIGIVLPDLTNPYFMKIARAIQDKCVAAGYHLLYMDTDEDAEKERDALHFLLEKRVDAIILAGTGENHEQVKRINHSGTPVLLIDRQIEGLTLDMVVEANETAAQAGMEFLIDQGHRRIGIVKGPQQISTARERFQGVLAALAARQLDLKEEYMFQGQYSRKSGNEAIRYFMELPDPPTALFSSNNEMTFGVYLGLQELGIPLDQVEVVSFGDLEFSSLFRHKLTVIMQDPDEMGQAVGELMFNRLNQGLMKANHRVLTPTLVSKDMDNGQ